MFSAIKRMISEMSAKNNNIIKDPVAAGRKGGKRKGKRKSTLIKEIITDWTQAEALVEKNILEFLQSKNKKERLYATRYLAEFAKAKKREISGELKVGFEDYLAKIRSKKP